MSIGEQLKKARLEKNLSLEAVSEELKISTKILDAIESDQAPDGPPPAILKGFIRSYAKFLKVDDLEPVTVVVQDPLKTSPLSESVKSVPVSPKTNKTKVDAELLEPETEASPGSWIKWAVAGTSLVLVAVGVRTFQKYQSEMYRGGNKITSEVAVSTLSQGPVSIVPVTDMEAISDEQNLPATEMTVSQEPVQAESEAATTPSPTPNEVPPAVEAQAAIAEQKPQPQVATTTTTLPEPQSPSPAVTEDSKVIKEVIVEARKSVTLTIQSAVKGTVERVLEPNRFYLFREQGPFQLRANDGSSLRVIVNGRILHSPSASAAPLRLEIKE